MSGHRGILTLAVLIAMPASVGCDAIAGARDRFGTTDTLAVPGSGSGLMLGLQAPGMLRAGEEGVLRISVSNRSDTTVTDIRLELIVPGWAEPMPPKVGDPEVTMAALPGGGTRFAYGMADAELSAGETMTVAQRIRVPAAGVAGQSEAPRLPIVRARLLGPDGEPLAEIEGEIGLDPTATPDRSGRAGEAADRRDQVGPVRLGMSDAALRQAAPSARDTIWTQEGLTEKGAWVRLGTRGRALAVLSGDSVTRIEVRDAAIRTREGLGVGSRLEELRAEYGTGCVGVGEGVVAVWFPNAPGISFALDAPVPASPEQVRQNPEKLPATASVTRWWVSGALPVCR